ncbi:MAG: phospholipase [Actinomycetia bacterium]|nr:phospholipase [Actinomycetes bacterium]
MRFRFAVLVAVTSLLTVVSPALAGPSATTDWAFVSRMAFSVPLSTFSATRATGDPWFDWTTDGCSAPLIGDTGRSFDFRESCVRHDFGYRNLQLLESRYGSGRTYWNSTNRKRVDQQFLKDMKAHCRGRALPLRPTCNLWAVTFFQAVRIAGGP